MNKNKILISLYIPLLEKSYDIYIPINKKVGTVKTLIESGLSELTDFEYRGTPETNLYSKETGDIYNVNTTIRDTNLKNGSKLILI